MRQAIVAALGSVICGFVAENAHAATFASLDFCADQYVLALADRNEIVGVSPHADTEFSYFAEKAAGLPKVRPTAEDILVLSPDLVIRQWGGGYGAGDLLKRFGVPTIEVTFGVTFDDARANLLRIGEAMGKGDRAHALAAQMDARYNALKGAMGDVTTRPTALYITPSGTTSGTGTFIHDVMSEAGVGNVSGELGTSPWHPVNLEALALSPPDMIVAGFYDLRSRRLDNWSLSRHQFLQRTIATKPVAFIPSREIACAAWFVIDAVEEIATIRRQVISLPPSASVTMP
ncbi:MAG: ABC transporter substrate-binding protein [Parvibaculum sp.]